VGGFGGSPQWCAMAWTAGPGHLDTPDAVPQSVAISTGSNGTKLRIVPAIPRGCRAGSKRMQDVTNLMDRYRECSRGLWNTYFRLVTDECQAEGMYEQVRRILFDALVLNECPHSDRRAASLMVVSFQAEAEAATSSSTESRANN
jgi:hypothetical protein